MSSIKVSVTFEASVHHGKSEVMTEVNNQLKLFFDSQATRAYKHSPRYSDLIEALRKVTFSGGKRSRPYLTVLAYQAYGGTNFTGICQVAAALELLHTAMLVHDDSIDRDMHRHGVDNILGSYLKTYDKLNPGSTNNAHHANNAALLAGDLLLSSAYEMMGQASFSHQQRQAAQSLMSEAVFRAIGGELIEDSAGFYPLEETNPLKIAELKTAHYSFVLPMSVGAVLADAPGSDLGQLETYGMSLGTAFQLADDLADVFANQQVSSDLREGRQNYLYITALELCDEQQKKELQRYFGNPALKKSQVERVQRLYIECDARKEVIEKIDQLAKKAAWAVDNLTIGVGAKSSLLGMIDTVTKSR